MKRRSDSIEQANAEDGSPSQKPKVDLEKGQWTEVGTVLLYRTPGAKILPKLAAFDMDGTLIATKSGKRFATSPDDWKLWSLTVPPKLRSLVSEKPPFGIVLITNQAAIERAPKGGKEGFKRKIEAVVKALGVPATVLIATNPDGCCLYRKPCTGGLNYLAELGKKENGISNSGEDFWDKKSSFYCGDAAGRIAGWKPGAKQDWACTDRLFALNCGLRFFTPEEFFLNERAAPFSLPNFSPHKVDGKGHPVANSSIIASEKELVVFVGPPACGKSSFSKHFISSGKYDIWSRDQLGTWQKVAQAAGKSLKSGRSVVIDNTNPDAESRSRYVEVAKDLKTPARCFVFDTTIEHAKHNERFRRLAAKVPKTTAATTANKKPHMKVPDVAFHSFKGKFQAPTKEEGFTEVVQVKFIAEFKEPALEKLYRSYLVEK